MSWNVSLFISGPRSIKELASEVSSLLGIKLQEVENDSITKYAYSTPDFTLDLYADHGMENDRDLKFQDYSYELSLWRSDTASREEAQERTLTFAKFAFEKLKATRRYSLMLVENSQTKLDSFGG
jgi:hypothetical protein